MAVLSGFEYDIFLSYRHNDNRSGWVTEFVNALQEELAATIKEPLTIYFDKNPHDGLLETHNVDKSLEGKLNCLIFIPIISQTYCDQKSFAWQHEFVAFNKLAKEDHYGRDIRLNNGNVSSRILPIKIHDLDVEDKATIEKEIGGVLRAIEFIYKEAGVNRPLKPTDSKTDNQNKTDYRNQVNKVANAIKEIIQAMKSPVNKGAVKLNESVSVSQKRSGKRIAFTAIGLMILFALIYAVSQYMGSAKEEPKVLDKSIAVLPFVDLSPNHDQEYLGIGMMDEILNHLSKIGDLSPVSRTSSILYGKPNKTLKEKAKELDVVNILEGSVSKSGDKIKITVHLIDALTDRSLWSETYEREMTDIFLIESEVAQKVAEALSARINPSAKEQIETVPTKSQEAYDLFLQANANLTGDEDIIPILEKVIELDPNFSRAYSALAFRWELKGYWAGTENPDSIRSKMKYYLNKAIETDSTNFYTYVVRSQYDLFFELDFQKSIEDANQAARLGPSFGDMGHTFQMALCASKKFGESLKKSKFYFDKDRNLPGNWVGLANSYFYNGNPQEALETLEAANKFLNAKYLSSENEVVIELGQLKIFMKDWAGALQTFEPISNNNYPLIKGYMGVAYAHLGQEQKVRTLLEQLHEMSNSTSLGSPAYFAAAIHVALGERKEAIHWLERAYKNHEVEIFWLNVIPIFDPIRNENGFKNLLTKINFR